ncbi:MAG: alpha/beta hydrolase [Puniceicoccales bacterium]|jgi:hypothetical protein|nr:alpha/beta hydrolase [Puniceicoccales bacterium]
MNKYTLILAHGFGFDHGYWKNLIHQLDHRNIKYLFFSHDLALDSQEKYVGLGHSLGFATLSNSRINFHAMLGLQCFCNFLGQDEKLRRIRKPQLDEMVRALQHNPKTCLEQFYNSCGYQAKSNNSPELEKLSAELQMLYEKFTPRPIPTLIIGSTKDKIVPKSLIEDNFKNHANVTIKYLNCAGHGLGHEKSDEIIELLTSFIHDQK